MRKVLGLITVLLLGFILVACGRDTYTVTFNSNGGSSVTAVTVEDGSKINEPTTPTRAGFTFDGWFKETTLTNAWDFDVDTVTSDITLYAKWTALGPTDQASVDATYDWLNIGNLAGLTNQSPRLILPTTHQAQGVSIAWSIDKTQFIATNGVISQPTFEQGDQTVTLTATLTKGTVTRTKVFTATVIALPSVEDTEPLINETFDYPNGNIISQSTIWGPVSGKTGISEFTVVDAIPGTTIPNGSKALKIEAFTELQIEAPIVHSYDLVIVEFDVYQTATTGASSIHIQSSSSSPVVAFGLNGRNLYYRVDNGTMHGIQINPNEWYTVRAEVDLENKTLEVFYYSANGQLISVTPGPVSYNGSTSFQSLFIRSGSSTTTSLQSPAYITNILANRIEALDRPLELVQLGDVTGIRPSVSVEVDTAFSVDTPVVENVYGTPRNLIPITEYTVAINNPVDITTTGTYEVTYTITNVSDDSDVKTIVQEVIVYSLGDPNEILSVVESPASYPDFEVDFEITLLQPSGTLYYLLSNNATETAEAILAGTSLSVTSSPFTLENIEIDDFLYAHFVVSLNGNSNVVSVALTRQEVIEIRTAQEFYNAVTLSQGNQTGKYMLLMNDIDFTGFTWPNNTNNKLWTTFDGNNHVISNLVIGKEGVRAGIFSDAENATIKNLVISNVTVSSDTSASALLVGEVRSNVTIENIVIMDSSISSTNEYAALLVGRARNATARLTVSNITVVSSTVTTTRNYAGGLVAGMDVGAEVSFYDIYLEDFESYEATETTGQMNGIIIGRIQGHTVIERVVAIEILVDGVKNIGGLVGKSDEPGVTVTIKDVYIEGEIVFFEGNHNNAIVGNISDHTPDLVNIWTSGFATVGTSGLNVPEANRVTFATIQNQAWWHTNIPQILASDLWSFGSNGVPQLVNQGDLLKPLLTVTLVYNVEQANDVIQIREGNEFSFGAPLVEGYNFVGWFTDEALTTPIGESYLVTAPVTLYGKYEALESFTVTFNSNGGSAVDPVEVFENEFALEPTAPTRDGYTFEGWYKENTFDTLFNFGTEAITADITLYAKWEEIPAVTFTVTFDVDGGSSVDAQVVGEGALATEPTDPTKDGFTFEGWYKEDTFVDLFDFTTETVTANITLYAKWAEIESIAISTAQELIDFLNNPLTGGLYHLENDIDITSLSFTPTIFDGEFDGKGYQIIGLSVTGSSDRVGMFTYFRGSMKNVIFVNANVTNTGRAGIVAGEIDVETAMIENVHFVSSSVSAGHDNGAGAIAGLISDGKGGLHASNISLTDVTVNSTAKNAGGLIGYVRGSGDTIISDVYLKNVTVNASNDHVGGIVGYVNNPKSFALNNVIIDGLNVNKTAGTGGYISSVLGRIQTSVTITLTNILVINDELNQLGSTRYGHTIAGRYTTGDSLMTLSNVYAGTTVYNQTFEGQGALTTINPLDLNQAWFLANMPTITTPIWDMSGDVPFINIGVIEIPEPTTYTVTFDVDGGSSVDAQIVNENALATEPTDPTKDGYTFEGWYKEDTFVNLFDFAVDTITADVTLYAKWAEVPAVTFTVSFNVDGGSTVDQEVVGEGLLATEPTDPTKDGYTFEGWYKEDTFVNLFDFAVDTITADVTLYAKWEEVVDEGPVGTAISTPQDFYDLVVANTTEAFYLENDLDFTDFVWTFKNITFGGVLDGNGKSIMNLNINVTGEGGLFRNINGGTVKDLIFVNVNVDSSSGSQRAGIIAGQTTGDNNLIENVRFINSSVIANRQEGAGLVFGQAKHLTTIKNVFISGSSVLNGSQNAGALIGQVDATTITVSDINILDTTIKSSHASDGRVGGLFGESKNAGVIHVDRAVIDVTVEGARYVGGIIGRNQVADVGSVKNVVITGLLKMTVHASDAGHINGTTSLIALIENVFVIDLAIEGGLSRQNVGAGNVIDSEITTVDGAWWVTNLPNIDQSALWEYNSLTGFYELI